MVMVAVVVAVLGGVMLLLHSPTRMAPDNGEPRSYYSIFRDISRPLGQHKGIYVTVCPVYEGGTTKWSHVAVELATQT